jgi:hypothetical protein
MRITTTHSIRIAVNVASRYPVKRLFASDFSERKLSMT